MGALQSIVPLFIYMVSQSCFPFPNTPVYWSKCRQMQKVKHILFFFYYVLCQKWKLIYFSNVHSVGIEDLFSLSLFQNFINTIAETDSQALIISHPINILFLPYGRYSAWKIKIYQKDFLPSENRELRHVSKNMMYNKCQGSNSIKSRTVKFAFILLISFTWKIMP